MNLILEIGGRRIAVSGRAATICAWVAAKQGEINVPLICDVTAHCGEKSISPVLTVFGGKLPTVDDEEFVAGVERGRINA